MTPDTDHARIRLEEVRDDLRTLEGAVPEPLTLEPAIRHVEIPLEAYERLGDNFEASSGDR